MKRRGGQRPTVFDGIVLVAASAVGMAAFRGYLECLTSFYRNVYYFRFPIASRAAGMFPWLTAWMLALLFLNFRRGGHPRISGARRPGIAACHVVVFWLALITVLGAFHTRAMFSLNPSLGRELIVRSIVSSMPESVGPSIGAVWFAMALARLWRRPHDWIEATSLALGVAWIVLYFTIEFQI